MKSSTNHKTIRLKGKEVALVLEAELIPNARKELKTLAKIHSLSTKHPLTLHIDKEEHLEKLGKRIDQLSKLKAEPTALTKLNFQEKIYKEARRQLQEKETSYDRELNSKRIFDPKISEVIRLSKEAQETISTKEQELPNLDKHPLGTNQLAEKRFEKQKNALIDQISNTLKSRKAIRERFLTVSKEIKLAGEIKEVCKHFPDLEIEFSISENGLLLPKNRKEYEKLKYKAKRKEQFQSVTKHLRRKKAIEPYLQF